MNFALTPHWREICLFTKLSETLRMENMDADREALSRTISEAVSRAVTSALNASFPQVSQQINLSLYFQIIDEEYRTNYEQKFVNFPATNTH